MRRWQFWLGILISVVFLFLALRKVDIAAAWHAALAAQWGYLVAGWLCLLASYGVRAWRWRVIVRSLEPVSLWTLWRVFMIGFMANNILPARIGELARAYVLGQMTRVDAASALGTIAVERVFDVLIALLLLAIGVAFGALVEVQRGIWLGAAMVGGLVGGVLAVALWGERLAGWGERVMGRISPSWGTRLADLGRSFVRGLRSAGSVRRILRVLFGSAASWALIVAYAWFVLRAYGLRVAPAGVSFLLGVAGVGVSIPSAPGSVGTLEYAHVLGLRWLGVGDDNVRASFALTYHAIEWVTTCSIGLFCLGQLGLSFAQLSAMARKGRPGSDGAS
jgi:uncharacterized protein (TIRG00374 family)